MSFRLGFGDAAGFGDCEGFTWLGSDEPVKLDRRRGFGDAEGFGDAGGFDWTVPRRRKTDPRG